MTDPTGDQGLGVQIINWTLEESLHLGGMKVHGYDMFDPGNVEKVSQQPGRDGASMRLFLGLSAVREVWKDS